MTKEKSSVSASCDNSSAPLGERFFLDLVGVLAASISGAMLYSFCLLSFPAREIVGGSVLAAVVGAAVLALAAKFNDKLIEQFRGFNVLLILAVTGICLGSLLLLVNFCFFLLIVGGFVLLLLLWTNYLVVQKHYFLNIVLLLAFLLVGSAILFSLTLDNAFAAVLIANAFAAVSIVSAYISKTHYCSTVNAFYSSEESRANMQTRKSNFSKNFAVGFALSISFAFFVSSTQAVDLGGGILAA